jgi:hypothetical protein
VSTTTARRYTVADVEALIGPLDRYAQQCHAASIALVKSGGLGVSARVARGAATDVGGQHSWVVLGEPGDGTLPDPYDPDHQVLDVTAWSYDPRCPRVHQGAASGPRRRYTPKGAGSIFAWGKPSSSGGEVIPLEVADPAARLFLSMLGPLDLHGWLELANAPVGGWPARAVVEAMAAHPTLAVLLPVDVVGMLTETNPGGLYLSDDHPKQ